MFEATLVDYVPRKAPAAQNTLKQRRYSSDQGPWIGRVGSLIHPGISTDKGDSCLSVTAAAKRSGYAVYGKMFEQIRAILVSGGQAEAPD
ncbi:hypothetical protein FH972_021106 [Carpinus fangiana]|uniref:Uncharacterized protein n=1 Tax=Carpinus fangiana TaxID=176857 RepID=A0A5N6KQI4_9ROSI|nr:hypothetical protein FH972_021106 [Carpinus fangiana]